MSLPRLQLLYKDELSSKLKEELNSKFPPKLSKIILNMGLGKSVSNKKLLDVALFTLASISGQKAVQTKVRQSNAGFGIRSGWPIGCKVTLRRQRMYEFLDRFLHLAVPRIPDFQGLNPNSFDGRGNYSIGLSDCSVFPECDIEQERLGLDITFVTTARSNQESYALLSSFDFPFKRNS